jgi:hypothetical protein
MTARIMSTKYYFRDAQRRADLPHPALVPELTELNFAVSPGGPVRPFEHNGNLIGYAIFDCEPTRYHEIAGKIESAVDIGVDAS